jgi:hypothetical protein
MTRVTFLATVGARAGAAWAAVPPPAALAGATPGLWEIAGLPGAKAPAKECVAELATLVQYEHRKANCSSRVLSDRGNSAVISYECRGGGFGRSAITAITPRSLRIETQGISDGLPFNYVLQARRIGECPGGTAQQAH